MNPTRQEKRKIINAMTRTPYARLKGDLESIVSDGINSLIKHGDDNEVALLLGLLSVHCQEIIIKMAHNRPDFVVPIFNAFTFEMREGLDERFAVEISGG